MTNRTKSLAPHAWVFKAIWRATAVRLVVDARNLGHAWKRAESIVRRMEGGSSCLEITCIRQIN
jgi:hypothetical protein